jgi:hypothetical protein
MFVDPAGELEPSFTYMPVVDAVADCLRMALSRASAWVVSIALKAGHPILIDWLPGTIMMVTGRHATSVSFAAWS